MEFSHEYGWTLENESFFHEWETVTFYSDFEEEIELIDKSSWGFKALVEFIQLSMYVTGFVGNSMVFCVLGRQWRTITPHNLHLLMLASIDLLMTTFLSIAFASYVISRTHWLLGRPMCYTYIYLGTFTSFYELFLVLSVFVTFTFCSTVHPQKVFSVNIILIITSLILALANGTTKGVHEFSGQLYCSESFLFATSVLWFKLSSVCLVLMGSFGLKACRRKFNVTVLNEPKVHPIDVALIVSYFVNWAPYTYAMTVYELTGSVQIGYLEHFFSNLTLFVRPLIYYYLDEDMRKEMRIIVSRLLRKSAMNHSLITTNYAILNDV